MISTKLKSYNYDVVGESNYQEALVKISGGYSKDTQCIDCEAVLMPEPTNPYDCNAVKVVIDKMTVGYIPASDAVRIGTVLEEKGLHGAFVEAQIRGGWKTNQHDQGLFGVKLKLPKSGRNFIS